MTIKGSVLTAEETAMLDYIRERVRSRRPEGCTPDAKLNHAMEDSLMALAGIGRGFLRDGSALAEAGRAVAKLQFA